MGEQRAGRTGRRRGNRGRRWHGDMADTPALGPVRAGPDGTGSREAPKLVAMACTERPPGSERHPPLCPEEGEGPAADVGWTLAKLQLPGRKRPRPHPLRVPTAPTWEAASSGLADAPKRAGSVPRTAAGELGRSGTRIWETPTTSAHRRGPPRAQDLQAP